MGLDYSTPIRGPRATRYLPCQVLHQDCRDSDLSLLYVPPNPVLPPTEEGQHVIALTRNMAMVKGINNYGRMCTRRALRRGDRSIMCYTSPLPPDVRNEPQTIDGQGPSTSKLCHVCCLWARRTRQSRMKDSKPYKTHDEPLVRGRRDILACPCLVANRRKGSRKLTSRPRGMSNRLPLLEARPKSLCRKGRSERDAIEGHRRIHYVPRIIFSLPSPPLLPPDHATSLGISLTFIRRRRSEHNPIVDEVNENVFKITEGRSHLFVYRRIVGMVAGAVDGASRRQHDLRPLHGE